MIAVTPPASSAKSMVIMVFRNRCFVMIPSVERLRLFATVMRVHLRFHPVRAGIPVRAQAFNFLKALALALYSPLKTL